MGEVSIRPIHDRLLVERIKPSSKTAGGIIIPETVGEKPQRGIVKAAGAGKYENGVLRKLDVKVGDEVLFGKYTGTEVNVDGKDLLVMREEDVMGIIEA
jgi:chaperonin GroES